MFQLFLGFTCPKQPISFNFIGHALIMLSHIIELRKQFCAYYRLTKRILSNNPPLKHHTVRKAGVDKASEFYVLCFLVLVEFKSGSFRSFLLNSKTDLTRKPKNAHLVVLEECI